MGEVSSLIWCYRWHILGLLALFVEVFGIWYLAAAVLATIINYPVRYLIFKRYVWETKKPNSIYAPDYEWKAYYKGGIIQKWWKRSIAKTIWEWIPHGSKLLDIGCGSSPIVLKYNNAVAVDANEAKMEYMRGKSNTVLFKNIDVSTLTTATYDHVLCIEVIEHLNNPAMMIKTISRLLKDGGTAIIATPDYSKVLWRIAEAFTPYKDDHSNKFTMEKLDRLCEKYNLFPTNYKYIAGCDLVEMFVKVEK